MTMRSCPMCDANTPSPWCCGIDLTGADGLWLMTATRIRHLRAYAHGTKGIDDDTYRLHLSRVGVQHTHDLSRAQYHDLLRGLAQLPDVVKVPVRRAG